MELPQRVASENAPPRPLQLGRAPDATRIPGTDRFEAVYQDQLA